MICGKEFYKSIKENHSHILDLMSRNKDCALLTWNPEADTLEEGVPGLNDVTKGQVKWRAVILNDADTFGFDHINNQNPFDKVDAIPALYNFGETQIFELFDEYYNVKARLDKANSTKDKDVIKKHQEAEKSIRESIENLIAESAAKIDEYRRRKKENYLKACENPLTRLAVWMMGAPMEDAPTIDTSWPEELLAEECPVDWNYYETVYNARLLPTEVEQFRAYNEKYKAICANFLTGSLLLKKPKEVIALSERLLKRSDDLFEQVKESHEELEYDNFCDDNLYPSRMKYLLFDVEYDNKRRTSAANLGFVSFVYMLSANELPDSCMRSERVYNGTVQIDEQKARDFFTRYLRKLNATKKVLLNKLRHYQAITIDDELPKDEVIKIFETDAEIKVESHLTIEQNELLAKYKIGLSRDCPTEEETTWKTQVDEIIKKFIRFLREPRRALKNAVKKDFKRQTVIEDERIFKLGEDSLEDIEFRIQEKEQQMVETVTNRLYRTREYTERIEKADDKVREQIARRMTKKKTLCIGLIVLFAYLLGFIPLFVGNMNNHKTLIISLIMVGICLGLMFLVGLIFLLIVRYKHKKHFEDFNKLMKGILSEIENGLKSFSKYLGHMCDFMRGVSVFNYLRKPTDLTPKILKKHLYDIQTRIDSVNGLFVSVMQVDDKADEMPYNYDFTKLVDYAYEVPYDEIESVVEFITSENYVTVPIDYMVKVSMTREDLYD